MTPIRGCKLGSCQVEQLDLSSLASVRRFTGRLARQHLDLIICNAGIMAPPTRTVTEDGYEQQFQASLLEQVDDDVSLLLCSTHVDLSAPLLESCCSLEHSSDLMTIFRR